MAPQSEKSPQVASVQGGVFTRRQAVQAGWTDRQVRRRLEAGRWVRVAGAGLMAAPRLPNDPRSRALALAWAGHVTWPEATVGHRTAAVLYGMPVDPGITFTCTATGIGARVRGCSCIARRSLLTPSARGREA